MSQLSPKAELSEMEYVRNLWEAAKKSSKLPCENYRTASYQDLQLRATRGDEKAKAELTRRNRF